MVAVANDRYAYTVQCQCCKMKYTVLMNHDDLLGWMSGSGTIHDMLPYLSDEEMETVISGTCYICWDLYYES